MTSNVADYARTVAARFEEYDALVTQGRRWTDRQLHREACQLAAAFVARGIAPGERIIVALRSGHHAMVAAEAAWRAARASSVLDGGPARLEDLPDPAGDPVFGGALRVAQALEGGGGALVGIWQRAPLQALARLHMLAAADQVDDDQLGRPRADPQVGPRLELLAEQKEGLTRAEITKLLGRNASEMYRMLERLVARQYVVRSAAGDRYSLSLKLYALAHRHPRNRGAR